MASRSGRNMRNEVRQILLTGLGEMDFVSRPHRAALFAEPRFWIVWRVDELRRRRNIVLISPPKRTIFRAIVLHPDLAKDLHSRDFTRASPERQDQKYQRHLARSLRLQLGARLALGETAPPQCGVHSDLAS